MTYEKNSGFIKFYFLSKLTAVFAYVRLFWNTNIFDVYWMFTLNEFINVVFVGGGGCLVLVNNGQKKGRNSDELFAK